MIEVSKIRGKETAKQWQKDNQESVSEKNAKRYQDQKEQRARKYRENKDEIAKKKMAYERTHAPEISKRKAQYYQENKGEIAKNMLKHAFVTDACFL